MTLTATAQNPQRLGAQPQGLPVSPWGSPRKSRGEGVATRLRGDHQFEHCKTVPSPADT